MSGTARTILLHYGGAVVFTAVAVLIRSMVDPVTGDYLPFATVYGAIALATWLGGYRPALLAVILGYFACDYLFIKPRGQVLHLDTPNLIGLIRYLFSGAIIIGFGEALRVARRRADRQRESLRVTLSSMGDAVITTDAEARVELLNSVAVALTGWTQDEAAGRSLQEVFHVIHEQTRQRIENPVKAVQAKGRVVGMANHTILIAKDGTERPIDDSAAPIKDAQGRVLGVILIFRDVTERRRAEQALRASEERTRRLLEFHDAVTENMGEGLYAVDTQGLVTYMNPAAESLFGWTKAELLGRRMHDMTHYKHPDGTPIEDCAGFQVLHQGKVLRDVDDVFIRKDGTFFPVRYSSSPLRSGGETVGLVVVFRDVTERRRAEEEITRLNRELRSRVDKLQAVLDSLANSEKRLAAELEAMTRLHALSTRLSVADDLHTALDDVLENAIRTSGADFGNIQLYNSQIRALEIVAQRGFRQDFLDYFRTVRVDEGSACAQAMQSGARIIIEDVNRDAAYEPHRPVAAAAGYRAVQSTPLKNRGGSVIGMLSTHYRTPHRPSERDERLLDLYARHATDLIERIRFEKALKDTNRRKDEFLATLAHELRNPLAPIRNAIELIQRADGNTDLVQKGSKMMERQVGQMVRLVDELLDISRITQGKVHLRKQRVELAAIVQSAVEATRPLIEAQSQEFTVTLPPDPVHVDADPTRLAQVFGNLVDNAAKYTGKGGRIRLSVERRGGEVAISVRDTGIGIAAEHLPRIFEMFSQMAPALERSHGGLGIGLSLVRGLIELHGGTVEARSGGIGTGSEFIVCLPMTDAPVQPAEKSSDDGGRSGAGPRRRILVVDDNRDAADSLAMILRMMGHETCTAYDGLEALQAAVSFRPAVVLLDIGLPKMNGYEAARHIRQQPWGKGIALIALTGWGQEEDKRRALEAGFDHHLTKPVDAAALEKLLAVINPVTGANHKEHEEHQEPNRAG
jgi:PAS domain S-box-containing protein